MRLISTILALALTTSVALAGETKPLSPGAPAGVKSAQAGDNTILYAVLGAGAVAFIAYAISQGGSTTLPPTVPTGTTS